MLGSRHCSSYAACAELNITSADVPSGSAQVQAEMWQTLHLMNRPWCYMQAIAADWADTPSAYIDGRLSMRSNMMSHPITRDMQHSA